MVDTRVNLAGVELRNPVIPASGTFGFGSEIAQFYDLNILGGISTKGTTPLERSGNGQPRIAETRCGMLKTPGRTSSVYRTGNAVSSPTIPMALPRSPFDFSSALCGAWSVAIMSIVPSFIPSMSASLSRSDRMGGFILNLPCSSSIESFITR